MSGHKILSPVLIVEDANDDLYFLKCLLSKAGVKNPIITVEDGREAQLYLKIVSTSADQQLVPCVILTDLQMPHVDGLEFVAWLRQQEALSHMSVIMLSGSELPSDSERARTTGVDKFFVKFPTAEELGDAIHEATLRTQSRKSILA